MKSENYLKTIFWRLAALFVLTLIVTWLTQNVAHCQVTVAIAPDPHPQFLNATGQPLSLGFIYTYAAGTTTLLPTYINSTGTTQNPDPIPLDATGAPTNGTVQTGIWLANQAYKFCAYNAQLVQQWCTDNITSYLAIQNSANIWTQQQTFSLPIIDTATDNQLVLGAPGNQTTFDFPPPAGNITIHMPNTADTMVGRATTDTLLNKTLTLPSFNGRCDLNIANQSPTGTVTFTLTKVVNAPSQAQETAITDTSGVVGITVSGAGTTGTACIQQSGATSCVFDGATAANDYITISSTTAGQCHDAGAVPGSGQIIGRVNSTNGGGGTYGIVLFPPGAVPQLGTAAVASFPGGAGVSGSCGTSVCYDRIGVVSAVVGTPVASNGQIVFVNFSTTYPNLAKCVIYPQSLGTALTTPYVVVTTSQLEIFNGAAGTLATGTYSWNYVCGFN